MAHTMNGNPIEVRCRARDCDVIASLAEFVGRCRRRLSRAQVAVLLVGFVAGTSFSADANVPSGNEAGWCPPDGPRMQRNLPGLFSEGQFSLLKPGWAVISMHVMPGAVPVSDVRVLSEGGSDGLARAWLPLVRQWIGCSSNQREADYSVRFTFGIVGIPTLPAKEAFSLRAFKEPRGEPELPAGDWGVAICPIRATLGLRQPGGANDVKEIEGTPHPAVRAWLETLAPDLDYMKPNPDGNRVEFDCKVKDGRVTFFVR